MNKTNWLRPICKEHKISLVDLGRRINKSKQYMTELNKGRIRLSYELAVQIAGALETTPDTLFLHSESSKDGLNGLSATGTDSL